MKIISKLFFVTAFLAATFTASHGWSVVASTDDHPGFEKVIVFMASGNPNLEDGFTSDPATGTVYDASGIPIAGDYHERYFMDRSEAELQQHKEAAIHFFSTRFNVSEEYASTYILPNTLNPNVGYRAIMASKDVVADEGWMVRDGGWVLPLPDGTLVLFGEYSIRATNGKSVKDPIIVHFQSKEPFKIGVPGYPLGGMFTLELWMGDYFDADLGDGLVPVDDTLRGLAIGAFTDAVFYSPKPSYRTILTFDRSNNPGYGTN